MNESIGSEIMTWLNNHFFKANVTFYKRVTVTLPIYADNAAALAGGLKAGDLYRNNADPDQVCVVH
jgi:hypothetical protein